MCAQRAEARERNHCLLCVQPTYCQCLHLLATLTSETILRKHVLLFFYLLSARCTDNATQTSSPGAAGTDLHLGAPPRPLESRARPSHSPSSPELWGNCRPQPQPPRYPDALKYPEKKRKKEKSPRAPLFSPKKAVSNFWKSSMLFLQLPLRYNHQCLAVFQKDWAYDYFLDNPGTCFGQSAVNVFSHNV